MSLSKKLAITDVELKGKRVLIRVDFNVPIQDGKITNPAVGFFISSRSQSPSLLHRESWPLCQPSSMLSIVVCILFQCEELFE
jgi:hypothetical protein